MKNSFKITTSILIMIFAFSSFGFGQEEVKIQKQKSLKFAGESKKAEVIIKSSSEYNYLKIAINCMLEEGDITIDIIDPNGKKQGTFTIKSDKTTNIGSKTEIREMVSGSMNKVLSEPINGEWIIRAIPSSAKGNAQFNIVQGFEPKIDMIDIKTIKE